MKEEPTIRMVHRTEKLMGPERVIHPCGKLCKSSNKGGYFDDELPDLPAVPTQVPGSRIVQTPHSPPTIRRTTSRPCASTETIPSTEGVSDVLSGYITSHKSRPVTTQHMDVHQQPDSRVVQTTRMEQSISDVLSGYVPRSAPPARTTPAPS